LRPSRMVSDSRAWALIVVWASRASMIASSNALLRSGELANCSLVLLAACLRSLSDSRSFPLRTSLT
jgi:hypothetical protein